MLRDKPIIKELNYTKEEIAEVKRIMLHDPVTKRKENIKSVLQGNPMCCICGVTVPTKKIEYKSGVIETYCDTCFTIYERNKDVSLSDIAERWNCEIAPPGTFGGSKKGYEQ